MTLRSFSLTSTARPVSSGSVHLDAVRGAAAVLVFANHTRALYFSSVISRTQPAVNAASTSQTPGTSIEPANMVTAGGMKLASEAVIIFFVLSGYLVGGSVIKSVKQKTWSWKDYMTKRLTRLWVPLIPCLLICVTLDRTGSRIFGEGSIYHNPIGIDLITSFDLAHRIDLATFFGNAFFLQGILVEYLGTDVSLWSLTNEFWYYIAFPCVVLALGQGRRHLALRLLYLLLAVAVLVFTGSRIAILFPIWLFGVIISMIPQSLSSQRARSLSLLALPVLLFCMVAVRFLPLETLIEEYVVGFIASAFIYLLIQQKDTALPSLYQTIARFFSQISYTLYIVHLPVAIFLAASINSPWHQWQKTPKNLALFLALDGLVLGCATLLCRLFEANTGTIRRRMCASPQRILFKSKDLT